jgi:MoaA/NifB/PqqE/SkfB family radical SAM enzyme
VVGVCTNATLVEDAAIDRLAEIPGVHVNVSLDGFSRESHGRFRGDPASFDTTVATIRRLADRGLLQGLLSTPHSRTSPDEYGALGKFASDVGASYLLINPLSTFGRGVRSVPAGSHGPPADGPFQACQGVFRPFTDRGAEAPHVLASREASNQRPLACEAGGEQ